MGLEMKVKRAILKELACKYQRSSKKGKGQVLEEFLELTSYNRNYGSWLLRNCGRKVVMRGLNGEQVIVIGEIRKIKRRRKRVYDEEFKKVLGWLWQVLDYSCGKRLVGSLGWLVPKLEEQRELRVNKSITGELLRPQLYRGSVIAAGEEEDGDKE